MVESHWENIRQKEIEYNDDTWELTGDVDIRKSGELIATEATRTGDVRHETAWLYFNLESSTDSLNPGNIGTHFDSIEHTDAGHYLSIKKEPKRYQYRLQRLEFQ